MIEHLDVDAYREALSAWDMDAVPLDRGDFQLRWVMRELPDLTIVRYSTAISVREAYVKEPGATAFVLMLSGSDAPFRVKGTQLDPMTLTLLQSNVEYEVISPAGGEVLEIYVPDELVASLGLERWLEPGTLNVRPELADARRLARVLSPLVTAGQARAVHGPGARAAVLGALASTLSSVDRSATPAPTVRLHAVYRLAVAAIEAEPDPMLTVVELAARLRVTTRTLRYAFGYALGISPYQYMLRRRLTIMRDALMDPSRPERTLLDLLLAHGITHQGEFAGQYRRLFGESPSATRSLALGRRRDWSASSSWPPIVTASR